MEVRWERRFQRGKCRSRQKLQTDKTGGAIGALNQSLLALSIPPPLDVISPQQQQRRHHLAQGSAHVAKQTSPRVFPMQKEQVLSDPQLRGMSFPQET